MGLSVFPNFNYRNYRVPDQGRERNAVAHAPASKLIYKTALIH